MVKKQMSKKAVKNAARRMKARRPNAELQELRDRLDKLEKHPALQPTPSTAVGPQPTETVEQTQGDQPNQSPGDQPATQNADQPDGTYKTRDQRAE